MTAVESGIAFQTFVFGLGAQDSFVLTAGS